MATAWYMYPVTQQYGQNGEKGVDIGTPFHTPITALYAGTVRFAGRTQWACGSSGGMITIVCNVPGLGVMTSYYLHVDASLVNVGDTVHQGQTIALSGGQLAGGQWPVVNCPQRGIQYSNGPHTEFGFNAPWVSGPGHQVDPTFAILQARNGTLPSTLPDGSATVPVTPAGAGPAVASLDPTLFTQGVLAFYNLSSQTKRVITQPAGFDGLCEQLDAAEQFADWNWLNPFGSILADIAPFLIRLAVVAMGFLVLYLVFREQIQAAAGGIGRIGLLAAAPEAAPLVAGAGLAAAPDALAK